MNYESRANFSAKIYRLCFVFAWLFFVGSVRAQTLPAIIIEPVSQSSAVGGTIEFTVSASGAGTLAYQWRKNTTNMVNGGNIVGANTEVLTLSNIALSDQANYTCWITNNFGSVTSSIATLSVVVPPGITTQPKSANKVVGTNVTFSVIASGTAPFFYQWYKDGTSISNATLNAFTMSGLFVSDSGAYSVRVSNAAGTIISSNAVLNVGYAPVIAQQPLPASNYLGETVSFNCFVTGTTPINLQWLFNGMPLTNQTNPTLTLTNLQNLDFGFYALSATNAFGGAVSSNAQLRLLKKWKAIGGMSVGRQNHTATLLIQGKVLFVGGYAGGSLGLAELYDPATASFAAIGNLANARQLHTATLLASGKVLVAGGYANGYLSSGELYNPTDGTWTNTGALNAMRFIHTATLLPNGSVLVAGGYGGSSALSIAELYDPVTGTWTVTNSMTYARQNHTATLLTNGKVLVVGGAGLSSVELYNPATGTWTETGMLNTARSDHTATLLPNGKVLVSGGSGNVVTYLSDSELYDPATGMWTATGVLNTARVNHRALLLPNGKVLVAGGWNGGPLSSAELYDPATGMWTTTDSLIKSRAGHSASLLPNGEVLVAGGTDGTFTIGSAELYDLAAGTLGAVTLTNTAKLPSGAFQFGFTNIPLPGATFTALSTTNLALPLSNWTVLGGVTDLLPGQFRFTDSQATNHSQSFYLIRSP